MDEMVDKENPAIRSGVENTGNNHVVRLIYLLNYVLLAGAICSIVLMFEIRKSPTTLGWVYIMVGSISILSAIAGFFSAFDETPHFFVHLFFLFSSLVGQGGSFLMLYSKPDSNIQYLKPGIKSSRDTRMLMKADATLFILMFCIQLAVLMLAYNCNFVDDCEDLEATVWRRGRKLAKVQEETRAKEAAEDLNKKTVE